MCMECGMYMEMQISICTMQIVVVVTTAVLCTEKVCVQPCTFDKRHTMVKASIEYGLASEQHYAGRSYVSGWWCEINPSN